MGVSCEGRTIPPVDEIGHVLDLVDDRLLLDNRPILRKRSRVHQIEIGLQFEISKALEFVLTIDDGPMVFRTQAPFPPQFVQRVFLNGHFNLDILQFDIWIVERIVERIDRELGIHGSRAAGSTSYRGVRDLPKRDFCGNFGFGLL